MMRYLFGGVIVGLILAWMIIHRQKRKVVAQVSLYKPDNPRDFLDRATNWFGAPGPLSELMSREPDAVVEKLISFLGSQRNMDKKTAAYALGQIGHARFESILESFVDTERVKGVREAGQAALVAVRMAPAEKGHSESERRLIIDKVYYKQP